MSGRRADFSTLRGRLGWVTGRIGLVVLVVLNLVLFEINTAWGRNLVIESLYGSYHWVPCSRWPTAEEAQRVLAEHQDVVRQIEAVTPRSRAASLYVNTDESCAGKADIRITFGGRSDKEAIREIIGDDKYLFGIPYRMSNT